MSILAAGLGALRSGLAGDGLGATPDPGLRLDTAAQARVGKVRPEGVQPRVDDPVRHVQLSSWVDADLIVRPGKAAALAARAGPCHLAGTLREALAWGYRARTDGGGST